MLAALILAVTLPNVALTPGATFPTVTAAELCKPGYTAKVRHVTTAMKKEVFARYGIPYVPQNYEVDHLIPLEIGGSNDVANLWPQSLQEARAKDKIETALHRQICAGQTSLPGAQFKVRQWARSGHW